MKSKTAGLNLTLSLPNNLALHVVPNPTLTEENAQIVRAILNGEKGPKRNAVLMNAGAALYIGGKAENMESGVRFAADLIDSGRAEKTLQKLIEISNRPDAE